MRLLVPKLLESKPPEPTGNPELDAYKRDRERKLGLVLDWIWLPVSADGAKGEVSDATAGGAGAAGAGPSAAGPLIARSRHNLAMAAAIL